MELKININVSLDLSDRLERTLTRLIVQGVTAEQPKETQRAAETAAEPVTEPPMVAEPELQPEPQPEPEPQPVAPVYDAAYVREVMEVTRKRIEGENYTADHPLHKALTSEFKRIAETISAGREDQTYKPTMLNPELIPAFRRSCAELYVDENGQLAAKLPF